MKIFTKILCTTALAAAGNHVSAQTLYDNFENTRLVNYPRVQGILTESTPNPGSNTVNGSATCALFKRDANQTYATFDARPKSDRMADVSAYIAGTKKMTMKFRSPAVGVSVQFVLQNTTKAAEPNPYPGGKYLGDFFATTTVANEWETLTFVYKPSDKFDATVMPTDIDEISILISPDSNNGDTYYIDDLMGPELAGVTTATTARSRYNNNEFAPAYPNPTSSATKLPFSLQKAAVVSLAVYDNMGRRVAQVLNNEAKAAGQFTADLDAAKLAAGLYTCRLTVDGVALSQRLSVQ